MNNPIRRALQLCLAASIFFAISGLWAMIRPKELDQVKPRVSIGAYRYPRPQPWRSKVADGSLSDPFATTPMLETTVAKVPVESSLILLGTLKGKNPQAIVAEKSNSAVTRIVKQGDVVWGEKIVEIGRGIVVVLKDGQRVRVGVK